MSVANCLLLLLLFVVVVWLHCYALVIIIVTIACWLFRWLNDSDRAAMLVVGQSSSSKPELEPTPAIA